MDEYKHKIFVSLVMIVVFIMETNGPTKEKFVWTYE
jgi:hypothetical protein